MKLQVFKIRLEEKFLHHDQAALDQFLAVNEVYKIDTAFVQAQESYWSVLLFINSDQVHLNENRAQYVDDNPSEEDEKILQALKLWRSEKSKANQVPTYCIATNQELWIVAKSKPHKKEDLMSIKGFGKHKVENYGDEILELVSNF